MLSPGCQRLNEGWLFHQTCFRRWTEGRIEKKEKADVHECEKMALRNFRFAKPKVEKNDYNISINNMFGFNGKVAKDTLKKGTGLNNCTSCAR